MPKRNGNPDLDECETYDLACELADRMAMKRQEAEKFVHNVMTQAGYRTERSRDSYVKGGDDEERGGRGGYRRVGRGGDGGFSD